MAFAPLRRILLPALVTFTAGFLVGQSWPETTAPKELEELPLDLRSYANSMVDALGLREDQAADLRILLFHYERERNRLLDRHLVEVDQDWVQLDQRFESLLAFRILDAEQRQVSDRMRQARTVAPSPAPR